jgi:hypothetical protein
MSDFNSSLPVRTETNGDVAAKIVDGTIVSQALAVDASGKISTKTNDGSGVPITSTVVGIHQALDVNVVSTTAGALDFGASAAAARVAALVGNTTGIADFNYGVVGAQTLRTASELGNAAGVIDYNFGVVGAQTIRVASEVGNSTGAADFNAGATGAQTLRVTANQGAPNTAANAWPISITNGGAANSATNPVFVTMDTTPGTSINDFKTAVAIAAAGSDNHDYTVTAGKTFYFNQAESSASGKAKMHVEIETGVATGVFTSRFVQFNSTANPNMHVSLNDPIIVAAGVRVRLVMDNKDLVAEDIYSTISGFEI